MRSCRHAVCLASAQSEGPAGLYGAMRGKRRMRHEQIEVPSASAGNGCGAGLAAGCETVYDLPPAKDATPGTERWECGDYFDGCGFLAPDCVTLTANLHNGTGEVELSGFVERTQFEVQGIQRRWDWCLNDDYEFECSFVISVDGTGRYYNFRGSDGQVNPTDLLKCTKR